MEGLSAATGAGPTDGQIKAEDDDGVTISYEFNEDEVVVGSALIRWNVGEVQWLESSYPAGGNGVVSCLLYTSPSPRDLSTSRMPSSA